MSDLVGKSLNDRYQVTAALGEGGMGSVYKAYDPKLQREVAVKVMHRRLLDKGQFEERFAQEALIIARLSHPGIVQVFDFDQTGTQLYIVMEFIPGENLEQMIRRLRQKQQWITLAEAIELIRQIAQALEYAHRQGVFHRDIKPANIMLRAEAQEKLPYRPIITDLGLAKLAEGGMETQIGQTMGTPAYMSPEQARGADVDARSDVYSLGILLYELTVGHLPFPVKSLTEALRYHANTPLPPPRNAAPTLAPAIETIIVKALAKDPDQRYATAGGLAQALYDLPAAALTDEIPPTAIGGVSSLLTQYQESLFAQPPSLIPRPPQPSVGELEVLVRLPDKQSYTVKLTPERCTIGRQESNRLVLEDARASRSHAALDYARGQVWVTDLGSTNGTFLGEQRLAPNAPTLWDGKLALRIGSHHLFLQAASGVAAVDRAPTDEPPKVRAGKGGTAANPLLVILPRPELTVTPGQPTPIPIVLQNQGASTETVFLVFSGLTPEWGAAPLSGIQLAPGARQTLQLTVQPPRSPQLAAGRYTLQIQAASQRTPQQKVQERALLTLAPFTQFHCTLHTQLTDQGEQVVAQVENQGNTQQQFQVNWHSVEQALLLTPPQVTLTVASGQSAVATALITPTARRLWGWPQRNTIQAEIGAPGGPLEKHHLPYTSQPRISPRLAGLVLFLLLLGGIGANWRGAFNRLQSLFQNVDRPPAATDVLPPPVTPTTDLTAPTLTTPAPAIPVADSGDTGTATAALIAPPTATALPTETPPPAVTSTPTADLAATATTIAVRVAEVQATQTALAVEQVTREWLATATVEAAIAATTAAQAALDASATQAVLQTAEAQITLDAASTAAALAAEATVAAETTAAAVAGGAAGAAATAAQPTPTPLPPPPPTWTPTPVVPPRPGQVTGFEAFGQWGRGAEPWGAFVQSTEQVAVDNFAAKLTYDFTTPQTNNDDKDYVVFLSRTAYAIPGQPKGLQMQVYGDGSGNLLNVWVQDSAGIVWAFTFGKLNHRGWQSMGAPFDLSLKWPNGIVQGGQAAAPTFPLRLYALVVDGEPRQTPSGVIFLDEIIATDNPSRPNIAGGQPASGGGSTNQPEPNITCSVTPATIRAGESVTLSWNISGVRDIFLDGQGVTGVENRAVRPAQNTTYTLRIIRIDGSETSCLMSVQVN